MPLTTRNVSPVELSTNRLDPSVKKDELLCIANGTLANLIRQLSSLSRNAEQLFSEVHREVLKIDHRANTLVTRIERLSQKVSHPDTRSNPGNLEENMARKAFKSYNPIDQHSLDRQTLPNSLHNLYLKCDSPPHLDQLNPYRDDPKSALRYYTDPSYFFDLWKQEILKECAAEGGDKRGGRLPPEDASQSGRGGGGRSPLRRRRQQPQQQQTHQQGMIYYQSSAGSIPQHQQYHRAPQTNSAHQMLQFPVEYQAPQHATHSMGHHYPVQPPPGMSLHVNSNGSRVGAVENYQVVGSSVVAAGHHYHASAGERPSHYVAPQSQHQQDAGAAGLSARMGGIALGGESTLPANIDALLDEEEDDELPPPPPILSSQQYGVLGASGSATDVAAKGNDTSSLPNSASNNSYHAPQQQGSKPMDGTLTRATHGGTIQYLPSGSNQHHANVTPTAAPASSSAPSTCADTVMVASVTVASFSATRVLGTNHDGIVAIDADDEESAEHDVGELRSEEPKASNLLMEIQSGIKLKKVQRQKEMEEVKSATESNDVAAILRRRMEHVLGCNDESSESSNSNDGEWD